MRVSAWCLTVDCMMKDEKSFWSFEVFQGREKTFVVISRLESRMSIRLMDILNGSMEQHNSP